MKVRKKVRKKEKKIPTICKSLSEVKVLFKQKSKQHGGIQLDIGCGFSKQPKYLGMDIRNVKGVDILHNVEDTPYPIPKDSCRTILMSHLMEHICPKRMLAVMDELWRIMKPEGQLLISGPYGRSDGMLQDPSHCNFMNENTFTYFDPTQALYEVYRPKPWKLERNVYYQMGNMEIILSKRREGEGK